MSLVDVGEGDVLTPPFKPAVSGEVPAHSWVIAPCGVGCTITRVRNLMNEPNKQVNNVVGSGKQLEVSLSRLK
jgi:hypothetical protein